MSGKGKNRTKKPKEGKEKAKEVKAGGEKESDDDSTPNQRDYGGLPSRDLKKNLGCG